MKILVISITSAILITGSVIATNVIKNDQVESATHQVQQVPEDNKVDTTVSEPLSADLGVEVVKYTTEVSQAPQSAPKVPVSARSVENETVKTDTNPYAVGNQEYITYNKRVANGQAVGMWGNIEVWVRVAQSQGVPVGITPQVNATCISGSMLYTVKSFTDTEITIENYLGYVYTRQIVNAACTFIY